jgi:hypothetical protein
MPRRHLQHPRNRLWYLLVQGLVTAAAGLWCCNAAAIWSTSSTGAASSGAPVLLAGHTPSASTTGLSTVTVQWSTSNFNTGVRVTTYMVRRYNALTAQPAETLPPCSGTGATASCVDNGVQPGSWNYTVTPIVGGWHGAESAKSAAVTVI